MDNVELRFKVLEVAVSISLTVNLCVVFYVCLPCIFKAFYKDDREHASSVRSYVIPTFISRM